VGRIGIVAFPTGRMPVTRARHYQWYDTPNIRVGTYADFEVLAGRDGLHLTDSFGLQARQVVRRWRNLRASVAVLRFW
jgi:Methionine biosynthesis protein MetW